MDNHTFRLGRELTVLLPAGDWYALQVAKEQRWLPALGPQLPLPIPTPVAQGKPGEGYPYAWSVYRWLEGQPAHGSITDLDDFATGSPASWSRCNEWTRWTGRVPAGTTSFAADH